MAVRSTPATERTPKQEDMADPEGSHAWERALVDRLRAGDHDAFVRLLTHYTDRLLRFACSLVGSRDGADDIVQQVWVQLWDRRAVLDLTHLKSYLFRAVRNRALDERDATIVRERYRAIVQAEASAGTISALHPSPEDEILTDATIWAALERLSDRRRLAIQLRIQEEMTHAEIADVLGVSPLAAQRLVSRAMAELRKIIWGV